MSFHLNNLIRSLEILNANNQFNNFFNYFNDLNYAEKKFPPANIYLSYEDVEKKKIKTFNLELAVAGYNEEDISISYDYENKKLIVESEKTEKVEEDTVYNLHKGISNRKFKIAYSLPFNKIKEIKPELKNGLLKIEIIPDMESSTIKQIPIIK